jgi:phage baseplate assembly protein gpV
MLYDPQNELTDEQMKELSEDDFFAYLDAKAAYLKGSTIPLDTYHIKRFTAISNNGVVSDEDMKRAKKLGMESEIVRAEKIKEAAKTIKVKKPDLYVKAHKTHRSQWFD